jgi:hypothetical protein
LFEEEDTAMPAQYIREKGFQEGLVKGKLEGKYALLEGQSPMAGLKSPTCGRVKIPRRQS